MRRPRLELPGIPQHITHRGVNRGATFIDDEDFAAYLQALELTSREQGVAIHGYVLMTNEQNGVRFTYPVSVIDLALAGRCAGRTPAKRWVLASTIARKASRP